MCLPTTLSLSLSSLYLFFFLLCCYCRVCAKQYLLCTQGVRKGVVFFQHGLTDNANGICLNPPDEGLPFILADQGEQHYSIWTI